MSSLYTLIPRPVGEFAGLDMASRYAFGLIYDRWQLSCRKANREKFTDKIGIYCVYSREAMAAEMGITIPTLRKAVNQLIDRRLIRAERPIAGGVWRYYIRRKALEDLASRSDPETYLFDVENTEIGYGVP